MCKRISLSVLLLLFGHAILSSGTPAPVEQGSDDAALYTGMNLNKLVAFDAFKQAMTGYRETSARKKEILVLIDFTKPSTRERFFVLDLKQKKVLYATHVAHGRNTGDNYAVHFSNDKGSYQSSLGFYLTENTYIGRNGYSLVLEGLEKGINDKARERAIVIHGADYANPSRIAAMGRLGRSHGCPALPPAVNKEIIDLIKGGALIYIYAGRKDYIAQSPVLNKRIASAG